MEPRFPREAWMTNMRMATNATSTIGEGQGTYLVQYPPVYGWTVDD